MGALTDTVAAFAVLEAAPASRRAGLLRCIADRLLARGDTLIDVAAAESALDRGRLVGERARTVNQLRMFADLLDEGSWVDARIDRGQPQRQPVPKPDLRRMLVPIGPVAVYGASNFPIAFSAAGGDSASALGAGCPVIFRGHPAHPRTAAEARAAIAEALEAAGLPQACFVEAPGTSHADALALVRHPAVRAAAFTGSFRAGRALLDAASTRPDPIPVYAEMGSLNPLVLLPSALDAPEERADAFFASMTLGAGQFCTKPGLVLALAGTALERFIERLADRAAHASATPMVYAGLCEGFRGSRDRVGARPGVRMHGGLGSGTGGVTPAVLSCSGLTFLADPDLQEEMFGPAALVVATADEAELIRVIETLGGQLTATVHGTEPELHERPSLLAALRARAGRLIVNGYPTGVEVCASMHHGGPYPATTDVRVTSVGTAAIARFLRPVCYQDVPQSLLPEALQDANPLKIWRLVDGGWTRG